MLALIKRLIDLVLFTPPRKIIRLVPLFAVLGVMPLVPLAYFTSRNPIYCANCHSKSREPELWRQSKVHPRSVTCIDCHATSRSFILRNLSAKPDRINPNCLRCHKMSDVRKIGAPGWKFKKNPEHVKIPHELHVEMVGAKCTDCHYDIVHDRREVKTNRPPMDLCLSRCHSADADNCAKCHEEMPTGAVPCRMARD